MIPAIVLSILLLDQLVKTLVTETLTLHQSVPVIKGIFHLTLVHNRGAAFGILKDQLWLFIITSVAVVVLLYRWLNVHGRRRLSRDTVALSLLLAGALGNLIDRIRFGYVIDFFDFRVWPVFNVADSAITVGAVLLVFTLFASSSAKGRTDW